MTDQNRGTPLNPTFHGYIGSTMDALVLFEACLSGRLAHVPRRPHDRERTSLIRSGNVFIYEEHSSGIKRWTDGVPWSPSRILGNFLLYRELDKPFQPGEKKRALKHKKPEGAISKPHTASRSNSIGSFNSGMLPTSSSLTGYDSPTGARSDTERSLVGSLVDSYQFKVDGLVKKTISVQYRGVQHHLVSYYSIQDVVANKLRTPTETASLQNITPRGSLISSGNFRAPVDDGGDAMLVDSGMRSFMPMPVHMHGYDAMSNAGIRSMSVPSVQAYSNNGWASHYIPSTGYNIAQTLPPPVSYASNATGTYAYDPSQSSYRMPQQSSGYSSTATMPLRRHSVVHGTGGNGQVGYSGMGTMDRSQMNSTPLISNGASVGSHGLPSSSYNSGVMFETSAAAATAASTVHSSNAYDASASAQSNGTYDTGSSTHHSNGFDGQLSNGYCPSPARQSLADFGGTLSEHAAATYGSGSHGTTPNGVHLSLDHSDSTPADHDWTLVNNESYQQQSIVPKQDPTIG
ncbi:Gti1/Pac2 family-domain-containing protein [Biscogniauxia sp. FL1348]|nr:Gti1/Pac2 family-domain-containing protein [Biscogniauxia sp. FL1348]